MAQWVQRSRLDHRTTGVWGADSISIARPAPRCRIWYVSKMSFGGYRRWVLGVGALVQGAMVLMSQPATAEQAQAAYAAAASPQPDFQSAPVAKARQLSYTAPAGCPDVGWLKGEISRYMSGQFHRSVQAINLAVVSTGEPQSGVDGGFFGRIEVQFDHGHLGNLAGGPPPSAMPTPSAATGSAPRPMRGAPPSADGIVAPNPPQPGPQDGAAQAPSRELPDGAWVREFSGPVCTDIVSALVMSVSVYLDELSTLSREEHEAREARRQEELSRASVSLDALGREHTFLDDRNPDYPAHEPGPAPQITIWGVSPTIGARLRTGITPGADVTTQFGLDVRGLGDRWAAARFAVAFTTSEIFAPSTSSPGDPDDDRTWDYRWWAASAHACPWGVALARWAHLLPCAATYLGNYEGGPNHHYKEAAWLGFWELTSHFYARKSSFVGEANVGLHGPVDPFVGRKDGAGLRSQRVGLVLGIGIGLMPDAWIFL
jgi:hypothetical protein